MVAVVIVANTQGLEFTCWRQKGNARLPRSICSVSKDTFRDLLLPIAARLISPFGGMLIFRSVQPDLAAWLILSVAAHHKKFNLCSTPEIGDKRRLKATAVQSFTSFSLFPDFCPYFQQSAASIHYQHHVSPRGYPVCDHNPAMIPLKLTKT
jgi:hypothetical protein